MEGLKINLETVTLQEIKQGFYENQQGYQCQYCQAFFTKGEVFPIGNRWFDAKKALMHHLDEVHGGSFSQLLYANNKYNTLTDVQKQLLEAFYLNQSDKEIAKALGVTSATVRRQRFTFKEKAKQAKMYLAVFEKAFDQNKRNEEKEMIPIPQHLTQQDDRFLISEKEREQTLKTAFSSLDPLKLNHFPVKEKKKVIILLEIAKVFEKGREYSEKEVNQMIEAVYSDYVTLRRYLIEYGFLDRKTDGSKYWLV